MSDDTAQFEAIAPTLRWMPKVIRENLSAKAVWTIIATAFVAGGWLTREITQREGLQTANESLKAQQDAQLKVAQDQSQHLAQLDTNLAVLREKVEDISQRENDQQLRWDRVEEGAEIPISRLKQRKPAIRK